MNILHLLKNKIKTILGKPDGLNLQLYKKNYSDRSIAERRFYNIGAGNFYHPYWTNVDGNIEFYNSVYGKRNKGIIHNLFDLKTLPVDDESAEIIYTSHTIEHIDNAAVKFLFEDCYRMLKPGGLFRIVVPDIEIAYRALKNKDLIFFYGQDFESDNAVFPQQCLNRSLKEATLEQIFIEDFAAGASEIAAEGAEERISDETLHKLFSELPFEEVLDKCTALCSIELQKKYPFRHINWFSEKKIATMLNQAGFKNIYRSGYLQSSAAVLRSSTHFDSTMVTSSLYMEAQK